ncbi:MAG: SoxR reducing system RseC family protein [Firmicutes bacterium]|nr:SoxR reducing system RseC family protein [Bacillota bacterium]
MIQNAIMKRVVSADKAEVAVLRAGSCGGGCASCAGCAQHHVPVALARNTAGARSGDRVLVRNRAAATLFLYLIPGLGFLLGYLFSVFFHSSDTFSVIWSFAGLIVGLGIAVPLRRRAVAYEITEILR